MLGTECFWRGLGKKKKKCFERRAHHPCGTFPPPSASLPQTPPRGSFDLKPGGKLLPSKLTAVSPSRQKGGTLKGEALERRYGLGAARGGDQTLLLPPEHAPPTSASPNTLKALSSLLLLLLLFRLGKLARLRRRAAGRGGLTAAGSRLWVSLPASVPLSRHLSGGNGSSRSSDSVLSAPSLQSAQLAVPLRGTLAPLPLFPPFHHSCTPETLLALWRLFIISGSEALNSWLSAPRLGAVRPGLGLRVPRAWLCLGQEAKNPTGLALGGGGVGGLPGGRRELAIPWLPKSAPLRESPHPSPPHLLAQTH